MRMIKSLATLFLTGALALSFTACNYVGNAVELLQNQIMPTSYEGLQDEKPYSPPLPDGTLTDSRLTEAEKKLVGIWESEEGWVLAVREAALVDANEEDSFRIDAFIHMTTFKDVNGNPNYFVTRRMRNEIEDLGDKIIFTDIHSCPVEQDSNEYQDTFEILEYDVASNTIIYSSAAGNSPVMITIDLENEIFKNTMTFYPTDKDIETADWDWYYGGELSYCDPR